jgi:mitochondrial division protein 1
VVEIDNKLEDMEEEENETAANQTTPKSGDPRGDSISPEDPVTEASFMSESIYQKLPSPRSRKYRSISATPCILEKRV